MSDQPARPLRIAALIKQVPEIESMTLGPGGRLQREGLPLHMNDYCRRAVAMGRRLAQKSVGSLTVVTLGPPSAENVLREAIAFGADDGVHVCDPAFAGSDSLATARALGAALRQLDPFDLVLLGRNSVDAETGQVPPQLASLLELPFAAGVREVTLSGEILRLRLEHDDVWVEAEVAFPAILSCAERLCDPCKIKDPALWASVDGARIRRISAADLGAGPWGKAGSPTRVGAVRTLPVTRARHRIPDGPVADQVAAIMRLLHHWKTFEGADPRATTSLPVAGTADGPKVVVVVEPNRPTIIGELLGAAALVAERISGRVVAFGPTPGDPLELSARGADEVLVVENAYTAQDVADALIDRAQRQPPWAVIGPSTEWGREVLGRAAMALDAGLTGDAADLEVRDGRMVATKPAFGGQFMADIHYSSQIQMATVRGGVFARLAPRAPRPIPTTTVKVTAHSRLHVLAEGRDDDSGELMVAQLVAGIGAGVDPDDYPLLRELAARAGLELCATRRVTDRGWMPRARQVGITGHTIAPRLYVSLASSGKFNHMVGARAAGTVLAINADPDAPVFEHADIGVVGDWRDVMPVLAEAIAAIRDKNAPIPTPVLTL